MSYRFFKVKREKDFGEIISQLFELNSEKDLVAWEEANPGWYDSKKDLLDAEEKAAAPEVKVEEPLPPGKGKLKLTSEQLKMLTKLLKGEQVGPRRGLSLTSFCNLFGVSYNQRGTQKKYKAQYDLLLKNLGDEIVQVRKAWYYKNAKVKGRKKCQP